MDSRTVTAEAPGKRPRSDSGEFPPIASKVPKTHSNHLQINYLARQYAENLPLVSLEDTMPAIVHLLGEYDGVLQRHESIAGNLGACPLGPILIKRFERLFDGPPRVLKTHGKDGPNVTWLDVVEFAKNKPEQFNLEKTRNGVRVCSFYTKQSRVEISEEDFVLIHSGMPQKMIPPQPIIEDEEKELGALEILEKNLQQIIQAADQVSARARQLNHRLKNRRTAIVTRRENDINLHNRPAQPLSQSQNLPQRSISPVWRDANGVPHSNVNGNSNGTSAAHSPSTGFVAVNTSRPGAEVPPEENNLSQFLFSHSNTENVTIINGQSIKGASPTTRAELMKKFFTTQDRQVRGGYEELAAAGGSSNRGSSGPRPRVSEGGDFAMFAPTPTTVAIPNTPTSLLPPPKSHHYEKDDGGPFKIEMVARMEELQRGERIMPPCDRCRRLHMDCLKNLTACMGCTKKHAKCSWRDVKEDELQEARRADRERAENPQSKDTPTSPTALAPEQAPSTSAVPTPSSVPTPASVPELPPAPTPAPAPAVVIPEPQRPREDPMSVNVRRESAPIAAPVSRPPIAREVSPRRAVSEIHGSHSHPPFGHDRHDRHDRRFSITRNDAPDDDVPDVLRQAIMDSYNDRLATAAKGGVHEVSNERGRERERDPDRDRKLVRA